MSKKEEFQLQQYRLVPSEEVKNLNENEIDVIELAQTVWEKRIFIVKITLIFIIIGLFIALFSPVEYQSEAILMPEAQNQEGRAGQLLQQFGGAFGLGGVDLSQVQPGMIPPMIYPRIVHSLSFQVELMEHEVHFKEYNVVASVQNFYDEHYRRSLTQLIVDYTVKLPVAILEWIKGESEDVSLGNDSNSQSEYIWVSEDEMKLIESLRQRISVNLDEETGLLTSVVVLPDPRAAAELNQYVIGLLKKYVTDYRVEKARQNLEFIEQQHAKAKKRFETAQLKLAEFRDSNINLSTQRARTQEERLEDEKNLAFNLYNNLSQQLEQARLQLQEQTPVFNIVQPVNVPSDNSSPKRALICVVSFFLGILSGVGWVSLKFVIK